MGILMYAVTLQGQWVVHLRLYTTALYGAGGSGHP